MVFIPSEFGTVETELQQVYHPKSLGKTISFKMQNEMSRKWGVIFAYYVEEKSFTVIPGSIGQAVKE